MGSGDWGVGVIIRRNMVLKFDNLNLKFKFEDHFGFKDTGRYNLFLEKQFYATIFTSLTFSLPKFSIFCFCLFVQVFISFETGSSTYIQIYHYLQFEISIFNIIFLSLVSPH